MKLTAAQIFAAIEAAAPIIETVVTALVPGGAAIETAIGIGVKIAQGVAAAEPQAVALYEQFQNGDTPTQAQLDAYAADEDGAYAKLVADLKA